MAWRTNHGHCPGEAEGKRVKVRLRDGTIAGDKPVSPNAKAGWPADGKAAGNGGRPLRWTLTGDAFDVVEWDFLS